MAAISSGPTRCYFEITKRCNLYCRHCYVADDLGRDKKELSVSEIKGIFDQLANCGVVSLYLTGGEVLTKKGILKLIKHARWRSFWVEVASNATMVTSEIASELRHLGIAEFNTTLLGATAQTHDYITRVSGSFDATVHGIRHLREQGLRVVVSTPVMRFNVAEANQTRSLAKRLGCVHRFGIQMLPRQNGSLVPLRMGASVKALTSFLMNAEEEVQRALLDIGEKGHSMSMSGRVNRRSCIPCRIGGRQLVGIKPNGDVLACPQMPVELSVGNLRQQSFSEIWFESRELAALPDQIGVRQNLDPKCQSCRHLSYCSRCGGFSYLYTGTFTKPYREACRYAVVMETLYGSSSASPQISDGTVRYRDVGCGDRGK